MNSPGSAPASATSSAAPSRVSGSSLSSAKPGRDSLNVSASRGLHAAGRRQAATGHPTLLARSCDVPGCGRRRARKVPPRQEHPGRPAPRPRWPSKAPHASRPCPGSRASPRPPQAPGDEGCGTASSCLPPAASSAKLDGQPTRSAHGQGRASGGVHQASADSTSRKPARSSTTGWSIGRTYLLLPATRAPERATREGYPAPAQPLAIAATDRSTAGKRKVHIKAARQDISLTATRATPPLECPAADPGRHQSEPETYLSGGYLSAPRWPLSGQPRTAPGMLVVREAGAGCAGGRIRCLPGRPGRASSRCRPGRRRRVWRRERAAAPARRPGRGRWR